MKLFAKALPSGFLFTLLSLCFFTNNGLAQGPWVQKKNTGFVQLQSTLQVQGTYTGLILKEIPLRETETNLNRAVASSDLGIYALYGLTDKLTIISQLPFKHVATRGQTDSLYFPTLLEEGSLFGLSNFHLSLKYGLVDKAVKVAASLQTNWNTASKDLEKGLATGYLANSFGLFGHVGGSLSPRWYSFLDLGYQFYTNGYSDFFRANFELGFKAAKSRNLWLVLNFNIRESMENGDFDNGTLVQTGLFPNDQEWRGYAFKIFYEADNQMGFTLGTAGAVYANYVGFAGPLTFGVFKKW